MVFGGRCLWSEGRATCLGVNLWVTLPQPGGREVRRKTISSTCLPSGRMFSGGFCHAGWRQTCFDQPPPSQGRHETCRPRRNGLCLVLHTQRHDSCESASQRIAHRCVGCRPMIGGGDMLVLRIFRLADWRVGMGRSGTKLPHPSAVWRRPQAVLEWTWHELSQRRHITCCDEFAATVLAAGRCDLDAHKVVQPALEHPNLKSRWVCINCSLSLFAR